MARKILVYTCGAFDLLHVGHLNILTTARGLGSRLIVGVSTDRVMEAYKPGQMILPYDQRAQIVAALRCVDVVVPQDDRDKFEAWKKLKYDILVVGDDWYGTEDFNYYERELGKVGVTVCYLPYTKGISSTMLRKRLGIVHGVEQSS